MALQSYYYYNITIIYFFLKEVKDPIQAFLDGTTSSDEGDSVDEELAWRRWSNVHNRFYVPKKKGMILYFLHYFLEQINRGIVSFYIVGFTWSTAFVSTIYASDAVINVIIFYLESNTSATLPFPLRHLFFVVQGALLPCLII